MDPNSTGGRPKRQPVPAGGQPTSAVIDAAGTTPPATAAEPQAANSDASPAPAKEPSGTAGADQGADASTDTADEAPASDAEAQRPLAEDASGFIEFVAARVLVAFDEHEVNDIVTEASADIERLKLAGLVDPHPDAVAYAERLAEHA